MADFFVRRVGNALHADGDESLLVLAELPLGKTLHVTVKQPRNPKHHRLYFAICRRIADGVGSTAENVDELFRLATGHFETFHSKSQGEVRRTKSISFSSMDQTAFKVHFEKCIATAYTEWGIDPEVFSDLLEEVK